MFKIILTGIAINFLSAIDCLGQKDSINIPQRNKENTDQYPYVNTPGHQNDPPGVNGTFDDPKIIRDSSEVNKDHRGRENFDSITKKNRTITDSLPRLKK